MTISHHLDPATLMAYAAGTLAPAVAAVAAQHLEMCPHCRRELAAAERIGRALLGRMPPADLSRAAPAADVAEATVGKAQEIAAFRSRLADLDTVPWRWIGPGLWHHQLQAGGSGTLHLLKAAPGVSVPTHDHSGDELTLVLRGALIEGPDRFGVGDISDHDADETDHAPSADPSDGCICVIGADSKVRFHGLLARLVQPYHGL